MAFSYQALNLNPSGSNDANFRAWGSGIAAAVVAVGLVKTTDTGQINWATVLAPSTTNQKRGYEIYRFDDLLQATRPVFIRLDFGSGGYQYNPQIWLTVGTATDGAGTITSHASFPNSLLPVRTVFMTTSTQWNGTGTVPIYVSSDGAGSLLVGGWIGNQFTANPVWAGGLLLVERTRDWDGTSNGEGVFTVTQGAQGNPVTHTLIITNAATYSQGVAWSGVPTTAGGTVSVTPKTGMVGSGVINVFPVFTGNTPQLNGPSKHVVALWAGDAPGYTRFPLTVYGEAGTYMSFGPSFFGWETNILALCGAIRVAG